MTLLLLSTHPFLLSYHFISLIYSCPPSSPPLTPPPPVPADSFAHNILEASWFELERDGEVCGEVCLAARFTPVVCSGMGRSGSNSSSSNRFGVGSVEQAVQYFSGPRPWYMRGGFYYDLSKRVYRRVKHIPLVGLGPSMGECVVEGVLTHIVLRKQPGEMVATESGIARLDHVVTGLITTIDVGIDQTKDQVLKKAVALKKQMTGEMVVVEPPAQQQQKQQMKKSSGIIWGLVEGTVAHVARPVTSYVPIVGGLGVQILDYIVPPPPPTEMSLEARMSAAATTAADSASTEGGASPIPTADVSAFDKPIRKSKMSASGF